MKPKLNINIITKTYSTNIKELKITYLFDLKLLVWFVVELKPCITTPANNLLKAFKLCKKKIYG